MNFHRFSNDEKNKFPGQDFQFQCFHLILEVLIQLCSHLMENINKKKFNVNRGGLRSDRLFVGPPLITL